MLAVRSVQIGASLDQGPDRGDQSSRRRHMQRRRSRGAVRARFRAALNQEPDYALVADERALLIHLFEYVARVDPDVLTGWNVIDFDLDYLGRKADRLGVEFALGRGGERAKIFILPIFNLQCC